MLRCINVFLDCCDNDTEFFCIEYFMMDWLTFKCEILLPEGNLHVLVKRQLIIMWLV